MRSSGILRSSIAAVIGMAAAAMSGQSLPEWRAPKRFGQDWDPKGKMHFAKSSPGPRITAAQVKRAATKKRNVARHKSRA